MTDQHSSSPPPQPAPWSALAVAGFVTSFFAGVIGLVLSIVGLSETARTGRRGRGLAIAGIIIGAADIVLGAVVAVLVVVGTFAWVGTHYGSLRGESQDTAVFGKNDDLPGGGVPSGMYQDLADQGWTPEDDSPGESYLQLKDGDPLPGYTDPTEACTAVIDMYTTDDGVGSDYDRSLNLLQDWVQGSDDETLTGEITIARAPAFFAVDRNSRSDGSYDVVRSTFTETETEDRGEARARVFNIEGKQFEAITAVLCDDAASLAQIGVPALERSVGAAW